MNVPLKEPSTPANTALYIYLCVLYISTYVFFTALYIYLCVLYISIYRALLAIYVFRNLLGESSSMDM